MWNKWKYHVNRSHSKFKLLLSLFNNIIRYSEADIIQVIFSSSVVDAAVLLIKMCNSSTNECFLMLIFVLTLSAPFGGVCLTTAHIKEFRAIKSLYPRLFFVFLIETYVRCYDRPREFAHSAWTLCGRRTYWCTNCVPFNVRQETLAIRKDKLSDGHKSDVAQPEWIEQCPVSCGPAFRCDSSTALISSTWRPL